MKRVLDLTAATLVLAVLSPVMLVVCLLLAVNNKGKIWFVQPRPGKHGRIFSIIKFKTMTDQVGPDGNLLPDEARLTKVGSTVRSLSLDELPQLFNVVKGEMSLVGPRPLLTEYLRLYNSRQRMRHNVLPGITGWAQVNGRNTVDWKTRFEYDVWYTEHVSLRLDLKILILTLVKVIMAEGVRGRNSMTMQKFTGND